VSGAAHQTRSVRALRRRLPAALRINFGFQPKSRTSFERSQNAAPQEDQGLGFARQRSSTSLGPNGWWVSAAVFLAFFAPAPALAQSNLPPAEYAYQQLPDARQEAEAKALMETLRCIVCQGQSIADSDADMAGDMRALVRRRIQAGERPEDIRRWLIERYGNWVSYAPPVEPVTWPLWAAPVVLLLLGLFLARGRFRRRARR
jgi:cytochrome c-type biogenesis protein CcmH